MSANEAIFRIDGGDWSLTQALAANPDDDDFAAWLSTAQAGDVFDAGTSGSAERIA